MSNYTDISKLKLIPLRGAFPENVLKLTWNEILQTFNPTLSTENFQARAKDNNDMVDLEALVIDINGREINIFKRAKSDPQIQGINENQVIIYITESDRDHILENTHSVENFTRIDFSGKRGKVTEGMHSLKNAIREQIPEQRNESPIYTFKEEGQATKKLRKFKFKFEGKIYNYYNTQAQDKETLFANAHFEAEQANEIEGKIAEIDSPKESNGKKSEASHNDEKIIPASKIIKQPQKVRFHFLNILANSAIKRDSEGVKNPDYGSGKYSQCYFITNEGAQIAFTAKLNQTKRALIYIKESQQSDFLSLYEAYEEAFTKEGDGIRKENANRRKYNLNPENADEKTLITDEEKIARCKRAGMNGLLGEIDKEATSAYKKTNDIRDIPSNSKPKLQKEGVQIVAKAPAKPSQQPTRVVEAPKTENQLQQG